MSVATAVNFVVTVDDARVLAALLLPFLGVITFLWSTEGTLALGSKWCTYCTIYAAVFLSEPFWARSPKTHAQGAPRPTPKQPLDDSSDTTRKPSRSPSLVDSLRWKLALGPAAP